LTTPANKLSNTERQQILDTANSAPFRDLSPKQIVPKLADQGVYLASESTFYRVLKEHKMLTHRQASKPAVTHRPKEHVASGPDQVWSWDITYLQTSVKGLFFYLYMMRKTYPRQSPKSIRKGSKSKSKSMVKNHTKLESRKSGLVES
jgi:hypothetical protein